MARKVFFSFNYHNDCWRASQVRNMGIVEGNCPLSDNKWEDVKHKGSKAIQTWIDNNLYGRSCTIVLIGNETADRKWIDYEIEKSWENGKGLLGIYIHNLKNRLSEKDIKGNNSFENFSTGQKRLSQIVKVYNPPYLKSTSVYGYIKENIELWVEDAIKIRKQYA